MFIPCLLSTSIKAVRAVPPTVHSSTGAAKFPTYANKLLISFHAQTRLLKEAMFTLNRYITNIEKTYLNGKWLSTNRRNQSGFSTVEENSSAITKCVTVGCIKICRQTASSFIPVSMSMETINRDCVLYTDKINNVLCTAIYSDLVCSLKEQNVRESTRRNETAPWIVPCMNQLAFFSPTQFQPFE